MTLQVGRPRLSLISHMKKQQSHSRSKCCDGPGVQELRGPGASPCLGNGDAWRR